MYICHSDVFYAVKVCLPFVKTFRQKIHRHYEP